MKQEVHLKWRALFYGLVVMEAYRRRRDVIDAVKKGRVGEVETLLNSGASVKARDKCAQTVLHLVIKRVMNIRIRLLYGSIEKAAHERKPSEEKACLDEKVFELFELLLARGADAKAKDWAGVTPLHLAAMRAVVEVIPMLVNAGADIEAVLSHPRASEYTPLYCAMLYPGDIAYRHDAIVALLRLGAKVNLDDSCFRGIKRRTPSVRENLEFVMRCEKRWQAKRPLLAGLKKKYGGSAGMKITSFLFKMQNRSAAVAEGVAGSKGPSAGK